MSFYLKSGIMSLVLGLTAVMVIYWVGIGSHNSTVCREQYHYSVEGLGYACRLLGFPTAYVENDTRGHNAHVYPSDFLLNLLCWSAACFAALSLVRNHLKAAFNALSNVSTPTRMAIILELLAVPLVVLILGPEGLVHMSGFSNCLTSRRLARHLAHASPLRRLEHSPVVSRCSMDAEKRRGYRRSRAECGSPLR